MTSSVQITGGSKGDRVSRDWMSGNAKVNTVELPKTMRPLQDGDKLLLWSQIWGPTYTLVDQDNEPIGNFVYAARSRAMVCCGWARGYFRVPACDPEPGGDHRG